MIMYLAKVDATEKGKEVIEVAACGKAGALGVSVTSILC
jgi:hypothetical protein